MAEVDVARAPGGVREPAVRRGLGDLGAEFQEGGAGLAVRRQDRRYVEMRADPDAGRGVVLADLAEQEQHEQGAVLRPQVRVRVPGAFGNVAALDVPAGVRGLLLVGEPQRETAQRVARLPTAVPDQRVERLVQHGGVDGGRERPLRHLVHPVHGILPGAGVLGVVSRLPPQQPCAVLGDAWRKGSLDLHETVFEEALHHLVVHGAIVGDRTSSPHLIFPPAFLPLRQGRWPGVGASAQAGGIRTRG